MCIIKNSLARNSLAPRVPSSSFTLPPHVTQLGDVRLADVGAACLCQVVRGRKFLSVVLD